LVVDALAHGLHFLRRRPEACGEDVGGHGRSVAVLEERRRDWIAREERALYPEEALRPRPRFGENVEALGIIARSPADEPRLQAGLQRAPDDRAARRLAGGLVVTRFVSLRSEELPPPPEAPPQVERVHRTDRDEERLGAPLPLPPERLESPEILGELLDDVLGEPPVPNDPIRRDAQPLAQRGPAGEVGVAQLPRDFAHPPPATLPAFGPTENSHAHS
jgi:hypothetical protein